MNWKSIKNELPRATKHRCVVYAPGGLYKSDFGFPSYHVLYWNKNNFGDNTEDILKKITAFISLPDDDDLNDPKTF